MCILHLEYINSHSFHSKHRTARDYHSGQRPEPFRKAGNGYPPGPYWEKRFRRDLPDGSRGGTEVARVCSQPLKAGAASRLTEWGCVAGFRALGLRQVSGAARGGGPCVGPAGGGAPQTLGVRGEDGAAPGVRLSGFAPPPRCLLACDLGHVIPIAPEPCPHHG